VADVDMEPQTVRIEKPEALNVTALTSVGFATALGALAGLIPAVNAACMDLVAALRY
jgi:ABC-type lipoprotein release transport system permease subunit